MQLQIARYNKMFVGDASVTPTMYIANSKL